MIVTQLWDEETVERRDKKTRSPGFFKDPAKLKSTGSIIAPPMCADRSISARIFPNGEFGVGYVPHRGISAQDRRYEKDCKYARDNAEIELDVQISPDGEIAHYGRQIIPGFPPPKLGLGSKSSQTSKKYGLRGITAYGKKMLRNAGTMIDMACKNSYNRIPQMGTLTIPSYSDDTMKRIAQNWSDIVRKFFQECKRRYAKFRYRFDYASCTEIQPERWRTRGEVGLHIHFLFVAIRLGKSLWALPDNWVREVWSRVLSHYLGEGEKVQLPNYRRETVRNSSAAYLAKYASKGGKEVVEVAEDLGEEYLPSQWWSISTVVRKCIQKHTIRSQGSDAEKLLVLARMGESEYVRYVRVATLTVSVNDYAKAHNCCEEIVLGYGGLLSSLGFKLFTSGNYTASIKAMFPRTIKHSKLYPKKLCKTRLTSAAVTS